MDAVTECRRCLDAAVAATHRALIEALGTGVGAQLRGAEALRGRLSEARPALWSPGDVPGVYALIDAIDGLCVEADLAGKGAESDAVAAVACSAAEVTEALGLILVEQGDRAEERT